MENYNLIDYAEGMAHAALVREESRGTFLSEDFPERDDEKFLRHIGLSHKNGECHTDKDTAFFRLVSQSCLGNGLAIHQTMLDLGLKPACRRLRDFLAPPSLPRYPQVDEM